MPGTYTHIDPGQGAISVNIRGMSGFGRVNTMVDGITQSFYGTSTSGTTTHGCLLYTSPELMPQELSKSCRSTPLVCSSIIVLLTRSRGLYDGEACAVRLYDNAHIVMIVVFIFVFNVKIL